MGNPYNQGTIVTPHKDLLQSTSTCDQGYCNLSGTTIPQIPNDQTDLIALDDWSTIRLTGRGVGQIALPALVALLTLMWMELPFPREASSQSVLEACSLVRG